MFIWLIFELIIKISNCKILTSYCVRDFAVGIRLNRMPIRCQMSRWRNLCRCDAGRNHDPPSRSAFAGWNRDLRVAGRNHDLPPSPVPDCSGHHHGDLLRILFAVGGVIAFEDDVEAAATPPWCERPSGSIGIAGDGGNHRCVIFFWRGLRWLNQIIPTQTCGQHMISICFGLLIKIW